jgi:hypothetical protein
MKAVIKTYLESQITFDTLANEEVMVNVTDIARHFGKKPVHFLRLPSTKELLLALVEDANNGIAENLGVTFSHSQNPFFTEEDFVKTVQSGRANGTWMHRHLAIEFAAWLDVKFKLWMLRTIEEIMRGIDQERVDRLKEKSKRQVRISQLENFLAQYPEFVELRQLQLEERQATYALSKMDKAAVLNYRIQFDKSAQ